MPIQQSDANPGKICQSITNLLIPCQSANPGQIRQSIADPKPICQICQSNVNLPIHYQSITNLSILDQLANVNFWQSTYPVTIHDKSAKTVANIDPSANPGLICQSITSPPIQCHTDHITITKWPLHKSISANNKNWIVTNWQAQALPIGGPNQYLTIHQSFTNLRPINQSMTNPPGWSILHHQLSTQKHEQTTLESSPLTVDWQWPC